MVYYRYIHMPMATRFVILLILCSLLASCKKYYNTDPSSDAFIETQPPILTPVSQTINEAVRGYYLALPAGYQQSSKKYPLLVFMHGNGQYGDGNNDLPVLLSDGIPELIDEKLFPPNFKVNGNYYSFIVLIPQFTRHPTEQEVESLVSYTLKNYRIDARRIYLSGLSNGGTIACDAGAAYPALFAAVVPIAGVSNFGDVSEKCKKLAEGRLPLWVFHNDPDEFVSIDQSKIFVSLINSFNPAIPPKFTIFPAFGLFGHDAWTKATNPQYRENGMNIYEWMLQYSR